MILAILVWIFRLYCLGSYMACGYVLWINRKAMANANQNSTAGDRIVASAIFFIFAPIVMGDVLLEKLAGGLGRKGTG